MHPIQTTSTNKAEQYQQLLPQLQALIAADADIPIANWFWVGFYLVNDSRSELVLAPFQGPLACTRIQKGRGVCGQAWAQNQTLVVPDVNQHPDHIACSSQSQSEIVVPLHNGSGEVVGVLDIDHTELATFDETDAHYLQQLCALLSRQLFQAA